MSDIGSFGAFANLPRMQTSGISQRGYEAFGKDTASRPLPQSIRSWHGLQFNVFRAQDLPAARFAEQPENFKIEPDQRDHQAKRTIPLHITGRAQSRSVFDHVKIQDQVQGGNHYHE